MVVYLLFVIACALLFKGWVLWTIIGLVTVNILIYQYALFKEQMEIELQANINHWKNREV